MILDRPLTNSERVKRSRDKNNDCITIRPKKDLGERIREASKNAGQPLTEYITQAILERMERESK